MAFESSDDEKSIADRVSDAVREAVQKVLFDAGGGIVNGYSGVIEYYDADGERGWFTIEGSGQSAIHTLGLVNFLKKSVDKHVDRYFLSQD